MRTAAPETAEYGHDHRARLFGEPTVLRRGFAALASLVFAEAGRRDFVDVSRYQGNIDWRQVRGGVRSGVAIAKVSEGASWVDPFFRINRTGMADAGFTERVFYHWHSPTVSPATQAAHLLRTIGTLEAGEGIMLDLEQPGITAETSAELADRVEQRIQRPVAGYTGRYVDSGRIWLGTRFYTGLRPRVLAAYVSLARARQLAGPHPWDAWQWASTVFVPGIGPRVDINQLDNHEAFIRICNTSTTETDMSTFPAPRRAYDTRQVGSPLAPGEIRVLPVVNPGARAVAVAFTIAEPAGNGWLTAWGAGGDPGTTNVSLTGGETVTGFANVPCDENGCIRVKSTVRCHLIVDLQGEERPA